MFRSGRLVAVALAGLVPACLVSAGLGPAAMAQQPAPESALTIYEGGFALVAEQRQVTFGTGRTILEIGNLPSGFLPDTAVVVFPQGRGIKLLGQRFRTPSETILERFVGRPVQVIRSHPTSGEEIVAEAILRSVRPRTVLEMAGRIEITPPGRIALPALPAEVSLEPTLVLEMSSEQAGSGPYRLSYLTEGFGWTADYALHLDGTSASGALQGRATLVNSSGRSFRNAVARLVAGSVNRVGGPPPRPLARDAARMMSAESLPTAGPSDAVEEVEVYDLPGRHDYADGEHTKIVLFDARKLALRTTYELTTSLVNQQRGTRREGDVSHPVARVSFDNTAELGLGLPLPRGIVRIYGGRGLFLGEDTLAHTAPGGNASLTMGQSVDITATRKRTDFKTEGLPKGTSESAYELALRNAKAEAVTVEVVDVLPGDWEVLAESAPHAKETDRHAVWRIAVPAGGTAQLTYRVRIKLP